MDFASIPPFFQIVAGAAAGAVGAYVAIRERLVKLETRQAADREHVHTRIGAVEQTALRAHARVDEHLSEQARVTVRR